MKRLTAWLLVFMAPALAYTDAGRLPYKGQAGELPLEVAIRFMKHRLGSQGRFDYKTLKMTQTSQPDAFDQAEIVMVQDGRLDDSIKATRQRLQLSRDKQVWTIHSITEDFACRRGRKGWGVKPCP